MELIGDANDHGFNFRVGKHLLVFAVRYVGLPDLRHPVPQVIRSITDGIQPGIFSFLTALEMGCLRDHPTAKDTYSNGVRSLLHFFKC
jgi:hypothetical protein